jgi:hypothetical protein
LAAGSAVATLNLFVDGEKVPAGLCLAVTVAQASSLAVEYPSGLAGTLQGTIGGYKGDMVTHSLFCGAWRCCASPCRHLGALLLLR